MTKTEKYLRRHNRWVEDMILVALRWRRFYVAKYQVQRVVEEDVETLVFAAQRVTIMPDKWNAINGRYDYSARE